MTNSNSKKPRLVAERRYPSKPATVAKAPAPKPARTKTKRKATPKKKHGFIRRFVGGIFGFFFRLIWGLGWRIGLVSVTIVGLAVAYVSSTLPDASQLLDARVHGSVRLLDREGSVFAWRGDQYEGAVTADQVSAHLRNAVIATEDKRFYSHLGISPRGIASAVKINLSEGRGALSGHGGSTLTQQTAKLLCLGVDYDATKWKNEADYEEDCRRGSLVRKAKEAIFALAMETRYTKNEILTIYFNRAFLGAGARGFEAGAQRYFGKSARDVTPAEAAMLAGLLVAPTRYAPTNNLQRAQERASVVIRLMEEQGYLTTAQAQDALANPAQLSDAAEARAGGYFADWVMQDGPEFFTRNTTEDVIIRTTLDQRMQKSAEEALAWIFENKVKAGSTAQAAIVVMSADGAVRAMVGGRKTGVQGVFNRATQARRQVGSLFKPFVYAAALDIGHSPNDMVDDSPLTINVKGSGPWSPANYTKEFKGMVTLTEALKDSLNIPAVRISESVGRETVRKVAQMFGIEADAQGPAVALGVSEATLLQMTAAYAGILNGGSSVNPYGLVELRLRGENEALMDQVGGIGERVIQDSAARELIYMMEKVVSDGTGQRAQLDGIEVAGKTGTTQGARDAWFIGFTSEYVTGVWMGNDDNSPLTGVTGGGLPADIWHETMARIYQGKTAQPLPKSEPSVRSQAPINDAPANDEADTILQDVLKNLFNPQN